MQEQSKFILIHCFLHGGQTGGVTDFQGVWGGVSGGDIGAKRHHENQDLGGVVMRHNEMVAADMQQDLPPGMGSDIDEVDMVCDDAEVA